MRSFSLPSCSCEGWLMMSTILGGRFRSILRWFGIFSNSRIEGIGWCIKVWLENFYMIHVNSGHKGCELFVCFSGHVFRRICPIYECLTFCQVMPLLGKPIIWTFSHLLVKNKCGKKSRKFAYFLLYMNIICKDYRI